MFHSPSRSISAAVASVLALGAAASQAQDSGALVDALVRKGILSDQEAEEIRADMTKEFSTTSAGKLNLGSSVTEMKIYGDLRLRYQYDNRDGQADPSPVGVHQDRNEKDRSPTGNERSRFRFRLRLNADFRLTNNVYGGVQLETSSTADSGNQTFQDGFSDYDIFIGRAWLGWDVTDSVSVFAGKMKNPFYTTDLIWDSDVNPSGLAQSIAFHKMRWGAGGTRETGYAKDGKAVVSSGDHWTAPKWELTLNAGQFIYDDNQEGAGGPDNDSSTDAFIFQTQLVAAYNFDNGTKLTVAPGWFVENAASLSGFQNENLFQDNSLVSGATRNINLILIPGDYAFKVGDVKARFLWDFAYNIEGRKRAENVLRLFDLVNNVGQDSDDNVTDPDDKRSKHSAQDDMAFLVGMQFGENKKAGDWSVLGNYRQTGIAAIDPNLNESDFAMGELNTRGFKVGFAYNFTDFAVGAVSYYYGWNLRDDLAGGEATGGNAIGDANVVQTLQLDLSVKF